MGAWAVCGHYEDKKMALSWLVVVGILFSVDCWAAGDPKDVAAALGVVAAAISAMPDAGGEDDSGDNPDFPAPPESLHAPLQRVRDAVRAMVTADISAGYVDEIALQRKVNEQLQAVGVVQNEGTTSPSQDDLTPKWGAIESVVIGKDAGRIIVSSRFSNPCGTDSTVWVFERPKLSDAYALILRLESGDFDLTAQSVVFGGSSKPLDFYLFTVMAPARCTSNLHRIHYAVLVPTKVPTAPKVVFAKLADAWIGCGLVSRIAASANQLSFQYLDPGVGSDATIQNSEVTLRVNGRKVKQISRKRVPGGGCTEQDAATAPADEVTDQLRSQVEGAEAPKQPQPVAIEATSPAKASSVFPPLPVLTPPIAQRMPEGAQPSINVDEAYERALQAMKPRTQLAAEHELEFKSLGLGDEIEQQTQAWCDLADVAKGHPYHSSAQANCTAWTQFAAIWRRVMASLERDADIVGRFLKLTHKPLSDKSRICADFASTYKPLGSRAVYKQTVTECQVVDQEYRESLNREREGRGDLTPRTQEEVAAMPTFDGSRQRFSVREQVVDDRARGLIWQRGHSNLELDWGGAKEYCGKLQLFGYEQWRLPTISELRSIVDRSQRHGKMIAPDFINSANWHWSGTPATGSDSFAWDVQFSHGDTGMSGVRAKLSVRCVRQHVDLK